MNERNQQLEEQAALITIPEFEDRINKANSLGADKVDLEKLHSEYHDARIDAAREALNKKGDD